MSPDPQLVEDAAIELGVDPSFVEKREYASLVGSVSYAMEDEKISFSMAVDAYEELLGLFQKT